MHRGPLLLAAVLAALALWPRPAAAQAPPETIEYYATDALGSIRVVFDPQGNVLGRSDYLPFGDSLQPSGTLPRQRFTGQERDGEAGMDYFNARSYHLRTGRFNRPDPLAVDALVNPQAWNLYAYVHNNPMRFIDPSGKADESPDYLYGESVEVVGEDPIKRMIRNWRKQPFAQLGGGGGPTGFTDIGSENWSREGGNDGSGQGQLTSGVTSPMEPPEEPVVPQAPASRQDDARSASNAQVLALAQGVNARAGRMTEVRTYLEWTALSFIGGIFVAGPAVWEVGAIPSIAIEVMAPGIHKAAFDFSSTVFTPTYTPAKNGSTTLGNLYNILAWPYYPW